MAALSNLFYKQYKLKTSEWFEEFAAKAKELNFNELSFLVKKLVDAGCWTELYNEYFHSKAGSLAEGVVSLLRYYELNNGMIDIQILLEKQLDFLSDLKEIEKALLDATTGLYFACEVGHLHIHATGVDKELADVSSFLARMKHLIEVGCESAKVSDKSYAFHSLHLSSYYGLGFRFIDHVAKLRIAVPLESFNYDLVATEVLLPTKVAEILRHKRTFSLGVLSTYMKDRLFDRHSHLTQKQYLDLKAGLKHPLITAMFTYLDNLNLNRGELLGMVHSGSEKVFTSIHQKINEIYSVSGTDKELNKELANYCWVSFTFIFDLQDQIDHLNRAVSLNTVFAELKEQNTRKPTTKGKKDGLAVFVEQLITTHPDELNGLMTLYRDFDTHKSFLSKRLFECFQRHLTSTSADKKLQFLKFFGAPDMRGTFKSILAYLTDRKPENLVFAVISLLSHSYADKAKALLNQNITTEEDLRAQLTASGLPSFLKYL